MAKNTIPVPFPVDPNPFTTSYPKGSYYLFIPSIWRQWISIASGKWWRCNYTMGLCYTSNFSSEIVSFFTDLSDATIGPKGTVIHNETSE